MDGRPDRPARRESRVADAGTRLPDYPVTAAILDHVDDYVDNDTPYVKYRGRF